MLSLAALADPTRRRIVEMLAVSELPASVIAANFDISPPAVSQHLKVLKEAHLVRARVEAQRRIYELDPAGFTEIDNWLGEIRRSWYHRLHVLESRLRDLSDKGGKFRP